LQTPAAQPEPERRGWGGFLGRKKTREETRVEPQAPRPQLQPRASAQVMTRAAQQAETARAQGQADDLFPDHKRDEQFEIPAFLRRQTS
jgi:hypothetical protein